MKQLISTFKTKQTLLLVMLSFLLISTSCTVRNYLQDQFKIPQTSVTNLSKYTIQHQENCVNFKEQITSSLDAGNSIELSQATFFFLSSFSLESNSQENRADFRSAEKWNIKSIPFYLLYQSLKLLD